jgi:hypothetical protein
MGGPYPDGNPPPDTFIFIDIEIETLDAFQNAADQIKSVIGDIIEIFIMGF